MALRSAYRDADEADEGGDARHLRRPPPEAVPYEVLFQAHDDRVALSPLEQSRHEFHHRRIGIEIGKRFQVAVPPATQQQAVGVQFGCRLAA